ncbi:MAG: DMT family transporter [Tissierellia bacterium]|nr:DMT family transporter [Tissierellia bacterium]
MNKDKLVGYLAALAYAIIIGFTFLFAKGAMEYGFIIQLAYRTTIAFIALLIIAVLFKKKLYYNKKRILKLLLLGILYPLLFVGIQTYGLSVTSSLEAGVAQAMAPVITLVLASFILNERTNILQKLSLALSVGGVIYIIYRKQKLNPDPNFYGLAVLFIATIAFSIYSVFIRKLRNEFTNFEIMTVIMAESAFVFVLAAIVYCIVKGDMGILIRPLNDKNFIVDIIYLGLLSSLASGLLINMALRRIEASKVVVFNNLSTVIQIFSASLILGEQIFFSHKIGSLCIILGVLGINFLGKKAKTDK